MPGDSIAVAPAISSVMQPPITIEGTSPSRLATAPDSNAPISLDEIINIPFTADTRPRIASGVIVRELIEITVCHKSCDLIDAEGGGGPELRLAGESDGGAH